MKKLLTAACVLAIAPTLAFADVKGVWKSHKGETGGWTHIQMFSCGGDICGKIIKAFGKDGKPNGDYEYIGRTIIKNMKSSDGKSFKGKIFDPETEKTYVSTMSLSGNKLGVKGCVAGGLICRNVGQWNRVK